MTHSIFEQQNTDFAQKFACTVKTKLQKYNKYMKVQKYKTETYKYEKRKKNAKI